MHHTDLARNHIMTWPVTSLNLYNPGRYTPLTFNLRKRKHSPHRSQQNLYAQQPGHLLFKTSQLHLTLLKNFWKTNTWQTDYHIWPRLQYNDARNLQRRKCSTEKLHTYSCKTVWRAQVWETTILRHKTQMPRSHANWKQSCTSLCRRQNEVSFTLQISH